MEFVSSLFAMAVTAIFIQNFVLSQFLGICPFLGVSKKIDSAIGMGMAVIFVMAMTSVFTWLIKEYLLTPLGLDYLQTIAFILTIAALVQFVEMVIMKMAPSLYKALGIYLPLITTNCAVLGVAILNINKNFNFLGALFYGTFAGMGFTLVLILMAGIRERLEKVELPKSMVGMPIGLVLAGCMALAFWGFAGMKF